MLKPHLQSLDSYNAHIMYLYMAVGNLFGLGVLKFIVFDFKHKIRIAQNNWHKYIKVVFT